MNHNLYTKVVVSGNVIDIYDYTCNRYNKKDWISNKEKVDDINQALTVKRLASTNFYINSILLRLNFQKNIDNVYLVKKSIGNFIDKLKSRIGSIQYLCVIRLPKKLDLNEISCYLLLNVSIEELLCVFPNNLNIEDYIYKIWGNGYAEIINTSPNYVTFSKLSRIIINNTKSPYFKGTSTFIKSKNLNTPVIYYGEKAHSFIKSNKLWEKKIIFTEEFSDENHGWVHHVEYLIS
jgi:hypothetical protein